MKLNPAEKNALDAIEYLLWELKVKVSDRGLKEDMVMHPDFPSVASVSDAFTEWRVPNMAVRLSATQLPEIPVPCIAYLNIRGGILAPIKSITKDSVEWLDTQKGWQKNSPVDFVQKWNGVTILLEPNEKSGEEGYVDRSKEQFVHNTRTPFLVLGTAICLVIILGLNWNIIQSAGVLVDLLLCVKLIGMIIGGLLLWQSLDADNPFLQNICHITSEGNCNNILQSKAAKITSWLSWSDVGFIYFTGSILGLALSFKNIYILPYLALLSLTTLPYTIYSVWYQRFVAKEWCILCMLAQTLLWAESVSVITFFGELEWVWDIESVLLLILAFLIPTLVWTLIKKPLIEALQLFEVQRELQKVKFNENYIQATFGNQSKMPPIFEDMQTAMIGDKDAPHVLTVVTNPLCGPCSRLHAEINLLLESNSNFQCRFVFLAPPKTWQIAANFLNHEIIDQKTLMESWYSNIQQSQERWIETHKGKLSPDEINQQFKLHGRWSELAGVAGTPTVYINGMLLPTSFKIRDLKRVVPLLDWLEDNPVTIF